ncbi:MAG: MgtC/SapB family protein [Gemmatimonadota bacterium]
MISSFPDWWERLALAVAAGAVIGLNRDLKNKPAGVRTHALVAIGSALLTLTGLEMAARDGTPPSASVSRIIQGIITGIGFLGAGVIIRGAQSRVHGLTTAASIWIAAAMGIGAGAGLVPLVGVALALTLAVLVLGGPFERFAHRFLGRWRPDWVDPSEE